MGLTAIAQGAVELGLNIAGDAKTTATLHLNKTQTYDFDTDIATPSGGSDVPVDGLFYLVQQKQAADSSGRDGRFLVKGSDAPNGIDQADTITIDGQKWNIYFVEKIPTGAAIILYLRQ